MVRGSRPTTIRRVRQKLGFVQWITFFFYLQGKVTHCFRKHTVYPLGHIWTTLPSRKLWSPGMHTPKHMPPRGRLQVLQLGPKEGYSRSRIWSECSLGDWGHWLHHSSSEIVFSSFLWFKAMLGAALPCLLTYHGFRPSGNSELLSTGRTSPVFLIPLKLGSSTHQRSLVCKVGNSLDTYLVLNSRLVFTAFIIKMKMVIVISLSCPLLQTWNTRD